MDFIYDAGPKELSLQSLTSTIIIQKILEVESMLPKCARDEKMLASRAIEVVNNLPLPLHLKGQLRPMVLPIMKEMQSWYQYKAETTRVVLTQNGMVDWPKSIRDMLNNENVSLMQRFKVACDHCLEQEIFDIGAQINFPHNFIRDEPDPSWGYWIYRPNLWSLDRIWYKIYKGNFRSKLGLKDISEDYCTQGLVQAFHMLNSAGVKYFVKGASPSKIGDHIILNIPNMYYPVLFTPDACIKLFKRLKEDDRQQLKSRFSSELLKALLKWPYQHQFLKAAESLARNMNSEHFLSVAAMIVNKTRAGWEDHDYKGLFINFWKSRGRESKISYSEHTFHASFEFLHDVILMRDEQLANVVLDNTTEKFKTKHFLSVCHQLIFEKHFMALELFVEVCRVNNDKLIVKFQKDATTISYNEEWRNILQEILSRKNKLKPQLNV